MSYPAPVAGLVIRYNYLWHKEKSEGHALGSKDRPCAIVVYHAKTQRYDRRADHPFAA